MASEPELDRYPVTRRTLIGGALGGGVAIAAGSLATGAPAAAQTPPADDGVARWQLRAANGATIANFARMTSINLEMATPPAADLQRSDARPAHPGPAALAVGPARGLR